MARLGTLADSDISSIFSQAGLSLLGETGTRVIFRSNITPDITIDVSGLMKLKAKEAGATSIAPVPSPEEVPISSADKTALRMIRPEVALNVLGNQISYAPYGRPERAVSIAIVFTLIAAALIGAKLAWVTCKKVK